MMRSDYQESHLKKAKRENVELESADVTPDMYDDHELHIAEHVKLFVASKCDKDEALKGRVAEHIRKHKELLSLDAGVSELEQRFEGEEQDDEARQI